MTRISRTTLQANGMAYFGLYGSTAALATTGTLAAAIDCSGIGFQLGTHTRWECVANDGTGAPFQPDARQAGQRRRDQGLRGGSGNGQAPRRNQSFVWRAKKNRAKDTPNCLLRILNRPLPEGCGFVPLPELRGRIWPDWRLG